MSSVLADITPTNTPAPLSLPEQLASHLTQDIVTGLYAKGQRLIETEIAALYKVSRGPVRDAFQLLERRRFVTIEPRKGVYVREISLNTIADIFNVRVGLFSIATRLMAQRNSGKHMDVFTENVRKIQTLANDLDTTWMQFEAAADEVNTSIISRQAPNLSPNC